MKWAHEPNLRMPRTPAKGSVRGWPKFRGTSYSQRRTRAR